MTINGGKPHAVGDRNQQYEIRCKKKFTNEVMVIGWTDVLWTARGMCDGVTLSPSWHSPVIIDRRNNNQEVK